MYQYRVIEKKTKTFFGGAMTAEELEELINEHASDGWELDRIIAGETAAFMGRSDKDVFFLVFKLPVATAESVE